MLTVLLTVSSAQSVFAAVLDQKQESGITGSIISAFGFDKMLGQEFKPSLPTLVAVDVKINTMNHDGDDTITLTIRQGTIGGAVLATATRSLTDGFGGDFGEWVSFTLTPSSVTPGSTYVIRLQATKNTFGWISNDLGNPYPDGRAIEGGIPLPGQDFTFRTYGPDAGPTVGAVGGIVLPTNTLTVLAPYLIMIGLAAVAATVYVTKRRLEA
jgi:hypothetical protein